MKAKLVAALAAIAVCMPAAAEAASQFDALQSQIDDLQAQINAIVPGPGGESAGQLFAHLPGDNPTTGKISASTWDECTSILGGRPASRDRPLEEQTDRGHDGEGQHHAVGAEDR